MSPRVVPIVSVQLLVKHHTTGDSQPRGRRRGAMRKDVAERRSRNKRRMDSHTTTSSKAGVPAFYHRRATPENELPPRSTATSHRQPVIELPALDQATTDVKSRSWLLEMHQPPLPPSRYSSIQFSLLRIDTVLSGPVQPAAIGPSCPTTALSLFRKRFLRVYAPNGKARAEVGLGELSNVVGRRRAKAGVNVFTLIVGG